MIRRFYPLLALALLLAVSGGAVAQPSGPPPAAAPPADLDAYVARVMQAFEVPGIALTVVKGGHVLVANGYGVRELGKPAPVDGRTLFGIASNTKIMTAAALATLVDEGQLQWDAPVVRYLPWFQMWDPYVTRELTIRDLLVHRSGLGLGAGDLLWWPASTYSRREIAGRLRFIRPATSFRSAYAYDNVLYLVAGEVIEAVSKQSWEEFVEARILRRVGMLGSNVRHSAAAAGGNVATPHARVDGKVRPVKPFASDNTNPAGGVNSSAEDMARWLTVFLARGKLPDGSRLFSENAWRQLTMPVTPIDPGQPPAELAPLRTNFLGYALGLVTADYRGQKVLRHTGGLPGFVSRVMMFPDLELGISVLTNQESGEAFDAIAYRIADHYLQAPPFDWLTANQALQKRAAGQVEEADRKARTARHAASRPSLPLARYAGKYADEWYGEIMIEEQDGGLRIRFAKTPLLQGKLEHWQYDSFVARWDDRELRADAFVTFALNPDGSIDQVKMRAVSSSTDFSFDFHDLLLKPVR
jgi:CubicO group peptidase (beta-lactamase class C family)